MDLHKAFESTLQRAPYEYAADVIERKFRAAGLEITAKQRKKLIRQLQSGDFRPMRNVWKFWDRKVVTVSPTEEDFAEIEERVKDLRDRIPDIAMEAIKTISPKIEEMLKASWFKEGLKNEQGLVTKFDRDVWTTWREPLELLWLVIDLACKSAENVNSLSQEAEPEHPHLREVMTRLHTRGVRIAKEILVLLRNGFADGAAARWRTLHETTVVAFFVWEHGEECAQQFLAHDAVELHRAAGAYARCCDKLGYDPMPQEEAALLEKEYQEVIEEFGPDFKKEYGWATKFLGKKRVFFSDLESAVDFDSMRFDYGQASHEVHVSARSLLAHLGLVEENTLLAGPSIHGLSQAGSNTARSLILLSATCVQVHPIMDAFISSYVMMLLAGEAHASFASIESKLTAEATPVE